jgi:glutathione S-transferase
MSDLKLYVGEKNISSWSMRAWAALTHKGVPFEEMPLALKGDKDRARRRAVSPTGKVPVLHHKGMAIPDSLAIIEYLEENFPAPQHPALWPKDAAERAHARWLAAAMHSGFMGMREGMSFNTCFLKTRPAPTAAALTDAAELLGLLEVALSKKRAGSGPYLFGAFGAADAMYAPAAVRLIAYEVPAGASPLAHAYLREVVAAPAVKPWMDAARALPPAETY